MTYFSHFIKFSVKLIFENPLTSNISGKGRVDSSDEEGSFNDAASMVSDVSEVFGLFEICNNDMTSITKYSTFDNNCIFYPTLTGL